MSAPAELLDFLWRSYAKTFDGRTKNGDVELLAEAAERHEWPGAPKIGPAIAALLRAAYCEKLKGPSPSERLLRDQEILSLMEDFAARGWTSGKLENELAEVYGMDPEAVRKIVKRKQRAHGDK
ncbi:hypothetical protein [Pseudorhodobacter wandonensis]|uniref:hypothetical protein n=1 Tax=Pseudorhodobacter wandonensis TaxID=1120568 RepID=UPI00067D9DF5|nr:hypothetical protein [Pseudorhodobacter wandonensis]